MKKIPKIMKIGIYWMPSEEKKGKVHFDTDSMEDEFWSKLDELEYEFGDRDPEADSER